MHSSQETEVNPKLEYHEICKWLPYKVETIGDIASDMLKNGYRPDRPIVLYDGKILDGRHRYEAAIKAAVEPDFVEFEGTFDAAVNYVTSENVARRHLSASEKEFFYVQMANAVGVKSWGGDRKSEIKVSNDTMVPSREDRADVLGVSRPTIARWEKDRKEIMADPILSQKSVTPEGFKEAKQEIKRRKATKEEAEKIAKLKSLGERSEAEAGNVERKLDRYREQGIDVDAVKSEKEKDNAKEAYREKYEPLKEMAREIAQILIDTKDYNLVASIALAAYPRDGELERAYNIIKGE
jgi:transcriptional regulator with XRE-family HTH domain